MSKRRFLGKASRVQVLVVLLAMPWVGGACATSGEQSPQVKKLEEIMVNEKRAASHYNMGSGHLRDGQVGLAIRELRIAENLNAEDRWIQLALAEAYRRKGLYEDTERHLLKALALAPNFQEARLTLSAVYIEMGRYVEAVAESGKLVDDPTFPVPWQALTNKGFAYYKLGQIKKATEALELATDYHEGYWRAILNLGIIDAERGQRGEAIRRFERVVELKPGPMASAEANYRIAELYIAMGDRDRAVTHLTAATDERPSGPWGKRSEEYLVRLR